MTEPFQLVGARLALPEGLRDGLAVGVEAGRIAFVGPPRPGLARVELGGALVAAGFIDTHVHGGLMHDVMDAELDGFAAIATHLAAHGVTAWLPTTVACPAPQLARVLETISKARDAGLGGARVLGAHLESNFIAGRYKGAQPEHALRGCDDAEVLGVIERFAEAISVVTLAPELPGALALIRRLVGWGIRVAVGHTDATYAQVAAAVEAGATRVTHMCNAQRGFHHREPGTLGAALVLDALYAEVIADLEHVHPAGLQIAYRCKRDRLMLVSDALRGTGLAPGTYELGGQPTRLDGRVARLEDGTIAGSVVTLERSVRHMVEDAGVPPADALAMAAAAPAASLGLADCGALAPGMRADLAVLDAGFACVGTLIGGEWAHAAREVAT